MIVKHFSIYRLLSVSIFIAFFLLSGCQKSSKEFQPSNSKKGSNATIKLTKSVVVSAHRANDLIKVEEIVNEGISSLEVDVFVGLKNGKATCLIGHEAKTATGQTLEQYFANLNNKLPGYSSLWLDCKDLNSKVNEALFLQTLNKMDSLYSIKHRVLVESMYPQHLTSFKEQGWIVSFYSNWNDLVGKTKSQQQLILESMFQKLKNFGVNGISFDARVYEVMKLYFPNKTVDGHFVKMYAWDLTRYFGEHSLATKLENFSDLDILLISFYPSQPILQNGGKYKIVSTLRSEPSKLVDVNGNPPKNGEDVSLWTNNYPTTRNQVWLLRHLGEEYYAFKSSADTTMVLEVRGAGMVNSTAVQVALFRNDLAQRWRIKYVGAGAYNLETALVPGKNLDVKGGSTVNDTQLQIYSAHAGNAQRFRLVKQ